MTSLIVRNGRPLRSARTWSSFNEFENLVDRIFNNYYSSSDEQSLMQMPIELTERDNNLIFKAMIPGLKKENINIEVSENEVAISGEYQSQYEENKDLIYRSEFFEGKFERRINLPQTIDHQKTKADYKDGILTITMPKSEKELNKVVKISL